jgi:polyisoprenoid-binding protein YceI
LNALALAAALVLAQAQPPAPAASTDLAVQPGSRLAYRLVHKLHEVEGVTREVEGRVRIGAGGAVQLMVRARVASFDSGNGNRDAHMQEATEAARFPLVTLKAVGAVALPAGFPATVEVPLEGQLDFHGQVKPVSTRATVTFEAPGKAVARARLTISLDAFGVERPSLLFVKVEDALAIDAELSLATPP